MLVTPRRSLRMEMPASTAKIQRKLRNLEPRARGCSPQDHRSAPIRTHASFAVDFVYVS